MGTVALRAAYAPWQSGQLHYVAAGVVEVGVVDAPADPPLLLLHQTPRSWKEYRAVLPLLGATRRVIAMDTVGFGQSSRSAEPPSIELWAGAAIALLDHLDIERTHVVGHHTGGVIAVELAARHRGRVASAVLSSTPFTDADFRRARAARDPIDHVEPSDDGTHLAALWQRRQGFYPPARPDLLQAFVNDAVLVLNDVEGGHTAVASYRMEDVIADVACPVLLIRATDDPFAAPHADELAAQLIGASSVQIVDVVGGMVPLPDQLPEEFAAAVSHFVDGLPR